MPGRADSAGRLPLPGHASAPPPPATAQLVRRRWFAAVAVVAAGFARLPAAVAPAAVTIPEANPLQQTVLNS